MRGGVPPLNTLCLSLALITTLATSALTPASWATPHSMVVLNGTQVTHSWQQSESGLLATASQTDQLPQRIVALETVLDKNPNSLYAQFHLANAYYELAKNSSNQETQSQAANQAQALFTKVLAQQPELSTPYFKLGKLALQQNDLVGALAVYKQGIAALPNNASLLFNCANVYEKLHQGDKAISTYQQALVADPTFVFAHNNLALLYQAQGYYGKAATHFKLAIRLDPSYSFAKLNLASLYTQAEATTLALRTLLQAHKADPNNPWVNLYLGQAWLKQGKLKPALAALKQAANNPQAPPLTQFLLCRTYAALNNWPLARTAAQAYLNNDPNGPFAEEAKWVTLQNRVPPRTVLGWIR